jgi:LmbE family N-acetylglucosaminyl deacetylase
MNLPLPGFLKNGKDGAGARTGSYGDNPGKLPAIGHDGPKTLMCIMAHPDDIDFGSAGSVARWCKEGWTVYYVLATSGDKGTHGEMGPQELAATREEEQREAARILGVKDVIFLGYPDGFLEVTTELRGQIVKLFRKYKPDVVLTWDGFRTSFNHFDHRNIGIAVRDAVFPAVRDHLYYPEHGRDHDDLEPYWRVNEMLVVGADKPDYFVDVTDFIEQKVDAILAHKSQVQTQDRAEMMKRQTQRRDKKGRIVESFRRIQVSKRALPTQEERDIARASLRGETVSKEGEQPGLKAGATPAAEAAGVTAGDATHGGAS